MPLELNGFKAWIESDGKELEVYRAETSANGTKITGWIASETGKVSSYCNRFLCEIPLGLTVCGLFYF